MSRRTWTTRWSSLRTKPWRSWPTTARSASTCTRRSSDAGGRARRCQGKAAERAAERGARAEPGPRSGPRSSSSAGLGARGAARSAIGLGTARIRRMRSVGGVKPAETSRFSRACSARRRPGRTPPLSAWRFPRAWRWWTPAPNTVWLGAARLRTWSSSSYGWEKQCEMSQHSSWWRRESEVRRSLRDRQKFRWESAGTRRPSQFMS